MQNTSPDVIRAQTESKGACMPKWVYNRYTGAKSIPPEIKARTESRILDFANQHYAGKFIRIDVRFRGALCYIDAYVEPDLPEASTPPTGETRSQWLEQLRNIPLHLCRIRYVGDQDRWIFAFYTYAHQKYEPSFLLTGDFEGTPEEAFATSTMFF
jgi:hypothetical protein